MFKIRRGYGLYGIAVVAVLATANVNSCSDASRQSMLNDEVTSNEVVVKAQRLAPSYTAINFLQRRAKNQIDKILDDPSTIFYAAAISDSGRLLWTMPVVTCFDAGVQVTNPEQTTSYGTIDLAEPGTGLYSDGNGSGGTLCIGVDGKFIREESDVTFSSVPFVVSETPLYTFQDATPEMAAVDLAKIKAEIQQSQGQ